MNRNTLMFLLMTLLLASCNSTQNSIKENNDNKPYKTADFDSQIAEKYWKLITLEGQEIKMAETQEREVYFMLKTIENKIEGFSGCNAFNGSYTLENGNRIRFSSMATTLKACPDVDFMENEFLKVFELANNYIIKEDTLRLNVGRRAPLAIFKAVYLD